MAYDIVNLTTFYIQCKGSMAIDAAIITSVYVAGAKGPGPQNLELALSDVPVTDEVVALLVHAAVQRSMDQSGFELLLLP